MILLKYIILYIIFGLEYSHFQIRDIKKIILYHELWPMNLFSINKVIDNSDAFGLDKSNLIYLDNIEFYGFQIFWLVY